MANQNPYPISGVIQYERPKGATAANAEGARIWIKDINDTKTPISIIDGEDVRATATNSSGQYILDLANLTTSYENGDIIRVYVEYQGYMTWSDHTVQIGEGSGTVNITLYIRSGLKDGVRSTVTASQSEYGTKMLGSGLRPGLKDGLIG